MIATSWVAASVAALLTAGAPQIQTPRVPATPGAPTTQQPGTVKPGPNTQPQNPGAKPGPTVGHVPPLQRAPGAQTASATPVPIAPPDQQLTQARQMAGLFTHAEQAMQGLQQAQQKLTTQGSNALAANDKQQLTTAINNAMTQLSQIRASVPYDDLQQEINRTGAQLQGKQKVPASAMQPLASAVQANKIYLQPKLVQNVTEAQNSLNAGDDQRAALDLKTASETLYNDVALAPIDQALADLADAQKAVRENNNAVALQKLQSANQIESKLKLEGPLVPVRFELRAAADAAGNNKHHQAQTLVQDAGDQLRHLRGTIGTWQLRAQLDPMIQKVANLRSELDAGRTPSASAIQQVADQATAFKYNESFRGKK